MQYIEGRPLDQILTELRRLRAEDSRPSVPQTESTSAQGDWVSAAVPPDEAASGSCANLAHSLWQGQYRAECRQDDVAAIQAQPGGSAQAASPSTPGAAGSHPPGSAPSSGLLADRHSAFAKSVAQLGIQVADALEYAAGQGVLHRDVKPSNLLLDVWGTVWLTDFGLAKATGTPDLTRPGDLLGTLRYMAPERFDGRADVRSDVYALGLTLYETLALRPAFAGNDQVELIRLITTAEAPRLERIAPRIPRDLITVVHKAIANDPADRYQTAGALAEDLRRFLDDRSILARRASLPEQAWRLCRRNPTAAALVATALALVLLATGGGLWLVQQQAERRAEAARHEGELRNEVSTAVAQSRSLRVGFHFHEARQLLEQARQRLEPAGPDDLRRQVEQARADLDLAEHLDDARLQAAMFVRGKFDPAGAEPRYAAAFAEARVGREGDDSRTVGARVQDSAERAAIVAALDDWASVTRDRARRAWLLAVARAADPDPARDRLRQPDLWQNGARLKQVVLEMKVDDVSPQLATALGRVLRERNGDEVPLLTAAQARFPQDFWVNYERGGALWRAARWDEALGCYRAALALRPEVSVAHNNVGAALFAMDRVDEAIGHLRQALQLDHENSWAHGNLGGALKRKGRLDEAIDHYQQAVRLDPKSAVAHHNLGSALDDKGRWDEAIAEYREAIRLKPDSSALVHTFLAGTLRSRGRLDEAIDHYQQAVRLDPKLAMAHTDLGTCLYAAACAAARAAAGQGPEKARLGEPERAGLRRQALDRLRTNLALTTRRLQDGQLVGGSLTPWQTDPALASVRDPASLAKLPDAERQQWQRLWKDVAAQLAADPLENGRARAARRQWDRAADGYARASTRGPTEVGHFWFEYAALLLLSSDRPGYAKACAHMIEAHGKEGGPRAYHVARACTLAEGAVAEALLPGRLAEKELKDSAREFWSLTEQGALAYRAGRYQQAVPFFEQSLQADAKSGRAVLNWLWLALANQRLGKAVEARRWLGKAQAWLDQFGDGMPARADEKLGLHLHNWLEAHVLRREAEALLDAKPAKLNESAPEALPKK
jgi:tetratricopeptide (TPR) repeat protein